MKLPTEIWMCENEQARWFEFEQPHDLPNDVTVTKMVPAQPEQAPVAYGMWDTMIGYGGRMMYVRLDKGQDGCTVPLYTPPPQRKPLTDEQRFDLLTKFEPHKNKWEAPAILIDMVEAAHGIKE